MNLECSSLAAPGGRQHTCIGSTLAFVDGSPTGNASFDPTAILAGATLAGACMGWIGGPWGIAGALLAGLGGLWAIRSKPAGAASSHATSTAIAADPEESTASGLHPLPLETTEVRPPEDIMGEVWRRALDACIDGLLITGPDEHVLYANPAVGRIFAAAPETLLGRPVGDLCGSLGDDETSTAGFRRTGSQVLGVEYVVGVTRLDGTPFTAEITVTPLGDRGMGLYQVRDVTERIEKEERARDVRATLEKLRVQALEASKAKSAFLANMSHELRTPLNAILGYSEMLTEELTDPHAIEDARKIRAAGSHLMSLINTILDLSKIEAGRMELFMETLSVSMLVEEVETLARPLAEPNHNRFEVEVEEPVGRMVADQVKLRQVLLNLLSNAFKFTEGGLVRLVVRRVPVGGADQIVFRVEDDGCGIAAERLQAIFEEFEQGDPSTSRKYGGTGLGLAISRRFCRMMGGEIEVRSEEGKGSTFEVRLPANTTESANLAAGSGDTSSRVLVIDDDPGVRELMARTLAGSGYQVLTASTGEQGIRRAKSFRPHVITLDVMMPGMSGWDVLAALKEDPDLHAIPVVMVSMVDERRKGYALGATAYLTKPLDRSRLLEMVEAFQTDQKLDVLVVDDDADVRELVRRTLERAGIDVREAIHGAAALQAIEGRIPDLVLLDLMMPELDGFGFLDAIGKNPRYDSMKVVILSAMDLDPAQRRLLEARVEAVLEKGSCSQEELLRLVRDRVSAHVPERPGAS